MTYLRIYTLGLVLALAWGHSLVDAQTMTKTGDKDALIEKIKELGTHWSKALRSKDVSVIRNLYDENAHYLPDNENAIHGSENIAKHWQEYIGIILDLELELETLEGTDALLYETGTGNVTMINQSGGKDVFPFKYVNVWKLQADGSYKVVIDTYNDVKPL